MTCDQYQKYELGDLDRTAFEAHARTCPECQTHLEQDAQLMDLAGRLKQPVEAPRLWNRIEQTLQEEQQAARVAPIKPWDRMKPWAFSIAAVLILGIGLGIYITFRSSTPAKGLLTTAALIRVENTEREYLSAINQLEHLAHPRLPELDPDLAYLYRERLATIDEQVARCKEAIAENPANAHVRRYLLAALQDKKQTLQELAEHTQSVQ